MYPDGRTARDRLITSLRPTRIAPDPWRAQEIVVEDECSASGATARVATVFLTGRECPWQCAMCDLWLHTTESDTPTGAIAAQVQAATAQLAAHHPDVTVIKLYNAGSFFDPRAVPEDDDDAVAAAACRFDRIIVESHPSLVGSRTARFLSKLARHGRDLRGGAPTLEVAMGLETAHPAALDQLNKRMTVSGFSTAASRLAGMGVALRVFLLISPPFIADTDQDDWLARSVDTALACGATAISLIPTRRGNGTIEALEADGLFQSPRLGDIERSLALALARPAIPGSRVFADLWDIDRFSTCDGCLVNRRERLRAMNLEQRRLPPVSCPACGGSEGP